MSTTQHPSADALPPETTGADSRPATAVDPDAVLELLSDEYARRVIDALSDRPASAPTLRNALSASRATIYRRLNELEAAGLVETAVAVDPDGHHRKRYHLVVEELQVGVDTDGIEVEVGA
ncbi:helix-turn-helix transcriptional regulator [Halonotius sp. F2-221B]|jgi:predicted transcriptional regulator|uniref:helix-turn-helix domain-containing protein n=1 Tax=Halonotius sp. F2-221B TaxID=2731620 RepID=UPI00398A5D7D